MLLQVRQAVLEQFETEDSYKKDVILISFSVQTSSDIQVFLNSASCVFHNWQHSRVLLHYNPYVLELLPALV